MMGKRLRLTTLVSIAVVALSGTILYVRYNESVKPTEGQQATAQEPAQPPTPLSTSGPSKNQPLTIVFGVFRPPYIFEKKDLGIDFDLAKSTLEMAGYKITALHSPNNRAFREIEMGKVDGVIGLSPLQDRPGIYFSKPIIHYDNVVITKRKRKLVIKTINDLKGIRFLTFSNAKHYLGPAYGAMISKLKYDTDITNQELQNRMFWQDKVDAIMLDLNVFRYYRSSLASDLDTTEEVDVHRIFNQHENERAAAFRDPKVRDAFNKALAELKANGQYQKILDRYLHIEPIAPQ